jgi:hypothetical protein
MDILSVSLLFNSGFRKRKLARKAKAKEELNRQIQVKKNRIRNRLRDGFFKDSRKSRQVNGQSFLRVEFQTGK